MKRTAATILLSLAIAAATLTPASAAPDPSSHGAPHARGPATPLPLCVTTPWRAEHTGQPMTKPGATCVLTPDMWKPRSWHVVIPWVVADEAGNEIEIVLARPTRLWR